MAFWDPDGRIDSSQYYPQPGEEDYNILRREVESALNEAREAQRRRTAGVAGRSTRSGYVPPIPGLPPCPVLAGQIAALEAALSEARELVYAENYDSASERLRAALAP